jgi:fermentation-respiration switch protein FrsA (DUF1100 family)
VYPDGSYDDRPDTPLLVVHGERDTTVAVGVGDIAYEGSPPPAYYLRLAEADHVSLFGGEDGELLVEALTAFLDVYVGEDPDALDALPAAVEASGRGEWRANEGGDDGGAGATGD